jgi:hypothetical protein
MRRDEKPAHKRKRGCVTEFHYALSFWLASQTESLPFAEAGTLLPVAERSAAIAHARADEPVVGVLLERLSVSNSIAVLRKREYLQNEKARPAALRHQR